MCTYMGKLENNFTRKKLGLQFFVGNFVDPSIYEF